MFRSLNILKATRLRPRRPWVAVFLSLTVTGLGQFYNGQPKRGVVYFVLAYLLILYVFVVLAYLSTSIIPGIIILTGAAVYQIIIAMDAYRQCKAHDPERPRPWYTERLVLVNIWLFLFFAVQPLHKEGMRYFAQAFKVPAASMSPTILPGDHILVQKAYYGLKTPFVDEILYPFTPPQRGDIIIFKFPRDESKMFIKRVIGLSGDTIEIREKVVYLNGRKLDEPYAVYKEFDSEAHVVPDRDNLGPITVPENSYFVMGDNRDHSLDSRFWGYVSANKITGKVSVIYWSWDSDLESIRWNRIGQPVS
jgi:signal peptidase I